MRNTLLLIFLISYSILSSQIIIQGKISDESTNEDLIGANIISKKHNLGTSTNINGEFKISIPKELLPISLTISYIGYSNKEINVTQEIIEKNNGFYKILLNQDSRSINEIKIIDFRLTQKQKENPLTVESLDILAIKETPSANFYDGLGALKGVDISAASLGFKIINTRGFNSTSPVRSLQIIDGVDNQAPGMNFSLGNFLGASELDIEKVEIIQGASSAYFGPNAFNGVI